MQNRVNRIYRRVDREMVSWTMGVPLKNQPLKAAHKPAEQFTYDDLIPGTLTKLRVDIIRATGGGTIKEIEAKAIAMGDAIDYGEYTQKHVFSQLVTENIRRLPFIRKEDTDTHKKRYYYAP